jgi:hypothetical protein
LIHNQKRRAINMKKQATETSDLRLQEIESRLAKLDPPPAVEVIQPYEIGSTVYSVVDREGTYPFTVMGYDRAGRILVQGEDDTEPRSWPLASANPLEKCRGAIPGRVVPQALDLSAKEYWEGKRAAEAAAKAPAPTPPPKEPKYRWAE